MAIPEKKAESACELTRLMEREVGLLSPCNSVRISQSGLPTDRLPESVQEGELAEKLLSEELDKLSLVEREQAVFDVHGVPQMHNEDPPNFEALLEQLDLEIDVIRNKEAYDQAKKLNKAFVTDRSFRSMFLRCDMCDATLAAQRMVFHFEVKKHLFGDGEVLGRHVRLSDLSPKDLVALESGCIQVLPTRDAAGRSIIAMSPTHRPQDTSMEHCNRALWYMCNTHLQDEDVQRKGIVWVLFQFGTGGAMKTLSEVHSGFCVRSAIPKKLVAVHYCFDDANLKPFVAGIQLTWDRETRKRFRTHCGSWGEAAFNLQTYGIPMGEFPFKHDGTMCLNFHKQWLNARRLQEENEIAAAKSIIPQRFDVLFGRSRLTREHTGNLRAGHLVEMHQAEYEKAGKFEKTAIAEKIVGMIHDSKGRFLKWEDDGWTEVEYDAAREKVSHFFRHLRSRKGESAAKATTTSATRAVKRVTPSSSPVIIEESHA